MDVLEGVSECVWRGSTFQYPLLGLCRWQHSFSNRFHLPHFLFSLFYISFGIVVHPQSHARQGDTHCLNNMYTLLEPDDRKADYGYTLDERGDRVCHWGRGREDCKGEQVLRKVYRAVEEKV